MVISQIAHGLRGIWPRLLGSQPGTVGSSLTDVFFTQLWVVLRNLLWGHPGRDHPQDNRYCDTSPANCWLPLADVGINTDAVKSHQSLLVYNGRALPSHRAFDEHSSSPRAVQGQRGKANRPTSTLRKAMG